MNEILFLIPYKITRPYFADLFCECEQAINDRVPEPHRLVLRCVPREDQELTDAKILGIMQSEFAATHRIKLMVVTPTQSMKLTERVAEVIRDLNIPAVALSLPFHNREVFDRSRVPHPPAIYCDSEKSSEELARTAAKELGERFPGVTAPHVVLVPGENDREDSKFRLEHFVLGLQNAGLTPEVKPLKPCHWQRKPARDEMRDYLDTCASPVHLVFAANDEMALGVRDAVIEHPSPWGKQCLVYGFDAVSEVLSLIEQGDVHMRGTVEQNNKALAAELAELVARLQTAPAADVPISPVPPKKVHVHQKKRRVPLRKLVAALDPSKGKWVSAKDAEQVTGYPANTLMKRRTKKDDREEGVNHDVIDGVEHGLDLDGRLWKKNGGVRYWSESLTKKKNLSVNRAPDPDACPHCGGSRRKS